MIFSNVVTDITYNEILPSVVDQINNSNVLTARVLSAPKRWRGTSMDQPVQYQNSNTGGSFDGMDTFSTAATNNTKKMVWYIKAYQQSVVVPGLERVVNETGDKAAVSLVGQKMDEAKNSMADAVGTILYGAGVGKNFDGLGLIVDAGGNSSSYGTLARSTNPWINGDVTPVSGGLITLDYLSSEHDNISAASVQSESPTIGLTTKAVFTNIESHIAPTMQAMYTATQINGYNKVTGGTPMGTSIQAQELKGAAGFNAISYRGLPIVGDDKCDTGTFFWLNERYLGFYAARDKTLQAISSTNQVTEGVYKEAPMPSAFQFREMMSPTAQYGEVGHILLLGNMFHRQPRRNGKLTGITGIA